jgi:hypothetical protein
MAMRAIIQQRDAAALVGIDVDRINVQVFALGFALAAMTQRSRRSWAFRSRFPVLSSSSSVDLAISRAAFSSLSY